MLTWFRQCLIPSLSVATAEATAEPYPTPQQALVQGLCDTCHSSCYCRKLLLASNQGPAGICGTSCHPTGCGQGLRQPGPPPFTRQPCVGQLQCLWCGIKPVAHCLQPSDTSTAIHLATIVAPAHAYYSSPCLKHSLQTPNNHIVSPKLHTPHSKHSTSHSKHQPHHSKLQMRTSLSTS